MFSVMAASSRCFRIWSPYIRWLWNKKAPGQCLLGPYHVLCLLCYLLQNIFKTVQSKNKHGLLHTYQEIGSTKDLSVAKLLGTNNLPATLSCLQLALSMIYTYDLQVLSLLKLISHFSRSVESMWELPSLIKRLVFLMTKQVSIYMHLFILQEDLSLGKLSY